MTIPPTVFDQRPAVPRRHLERGLHVDNVLASLRDDLDEATLGLTTWCLELVATHSHLRSPRIDPESGSASRTEVDEDGHLVRDQPPTTVEAAAFTRPDPLLPVAERYLRHLEERDARGIAVCARIIRSKVDPGDLANPCRICGQRVPLRSKRAGECPSCERSRQRERERTE